MQEKVVRQYMLFLSLFVLSGMMSGGVYVTYLRENGLSLLQVNLVNSIYYLVLFICEIPTGAFADVFGRKKSVVIACLLRGSASIIYGSSSTVTGFIVAEIVAALGATFVSGALKAWLVDSLVHQGYEPGNVRIFGRAKAYAQLMGMAGCITGSFVAMYSVRLSWILGGFTGIITAFIVLHNMKEEYFVPKEYSWKKGFSMMKKTAVSSIRYGMQEKAVRFILVCTFIQIFAVQAFNMYWQPFFGNRGIDKAYFGIIFAVMLASLAGGAKIASLMHENGKEKILIVGSQIIVGLIILAVTFSTSLPLVLFLFLLHEVGRGFWEPMRDSYLHKHIPSHERATIDSFCCISPHIGGAIGLVISGGIAEYWGIPLSWTISAFVLILGALLVARNGSHRDR